MKKVFTLLTGTALALAFSVSAAQAHYDGTEHAHPFTPSVQITSPAANTTVPTVFTVSGTANPNCVMDNQVYVMDNENGGPVEVTPRRNGQTFSYSIDTSKVLTHEGLDPYTLKNGRISVTVYYDYQDTDCQPTGDDGYDEVILTLKHPGEVPDPTAVKKNIDVPDEIEKVVSPSPTATAKPRYEETPAAVEDDFWNKLDAPWWYLLGVLTGGLIVAGVEAMSRRYMAKHNKGVTKR